MYRILNHPMKTETIRALIVDDEPAARQRIRDLLKPVEDVEVVDECADGPKAIAAISSRKPDLVFLDVQIPYVDGFGVLQALTEDTLPVIIFVTAFDEFAVRAFEVNAIDYLLKPYDSQRFNTALERARRQLSARVSGGRLEQYRALLSATSGAVKYQQRIPVRSSGQVNFLRVEGIHWIEGAGNYARLHANGGEHLVRETLQTLEGKLDPQSFVRTHRSAIVNLDSIERLEKWFEGEYVVILRNGDRVPLSRRRYRDLKTHLT